VPEGNEIHRHSLRQSEFFAGKVVSVEAPNGRFEAGAKLLHKRRLRSIEAYGKHLFYDFGPNRALHIHLGLYGKFRDGEMPYPDARGALRLRISTKRHWLELRGPTDCTVFNEEQKEALIGRLGPDPLRHDAKPDLAIRRIRRSRSPIGGLLMDQSVISGLGNIYRAELLYRSRLHPLQSGMSTSEKQLKALWKDAVVLMRAGMVDRRIVTTRRADRPHPTGKARRFETHYVYRRKGLPCFLCGTTIRMEIFIGRKLYWCPTCQALPDATSS
jgi:endonuclease-8